MAIKICPCCGETFQPHHKVSTQTYCSSPNCQRERRQIWDRKKQESDPEYRDNKNRVQRSWTERNPDYWRKYRKVNPDALKKTQVSSKQSALIETELVKMDELALRVAQYRQRMAILADALYLPWATEPKNESKEHDRFETRVFEVDTSGGLYGGSVAVFQVWRTDVDVEEDVPVFGPEPIWQ